MKVPYVGAATDHGSFVGPSLLVHMSAIPFRGWSAAVDTVIHPVAGELTPSA